MVTAFHGFHSLVENNPQAISALDKSGKIIYSSAANTKLFGRTPADMVGRHWMELVHPDDRDISSQFFEKTIARLPGPLCWDLRVRCGNGDYCWVENTACNLLPDQSVQAIVIYQRDIQDRLMDEQRYQLRTDDMVRSNIRMEEFAYTVAHDLREPLRSLTVFSQILLQKVKLNIEAVGIAELILDGALRMSRLVGSLLSFAHTGMHAPPRMVDLRLAAESALKNLFMEIEESGAAVTLAELPILCTDETHVVMLFQNLVSNAIKYRSSAPCLIHVSAEQEGTNWVIRVKDNGLGIAAEYHSRVFIPFVRLADRDIPGTGLGLALCKKIVEGLGGRIWVESEPGLGSTFAFAIAPGANASDDVLFTQNKLKAGRPYMVKRRAIVTSS